MGYVWTAGDALSSARLNQTGRDIIEITAGENLTAGDVVYIPNYNLEVLSASADTHVASGTPTTNYGTSTTVSTGGAGSSYEAYVQFSFTTAPSATEVLNAYLLLSWNSNANTGTGTIQRITSTWAEGTVTWNTKPTSTTVNQVSITGTGTTNVGHQAFDVTTLFQDIQNNTNYGFKVTTTGATGTTSFNSKEHATTYYAPRFVVWGVDTNAGSAYKISSLTAEKQRLGYTGVVLNTVTSGSTAYVLRSGKVTGLTGLTAGTRYYSTSAGALSSTESVFPVGYATSTTELIVTPPKQLTVSSINLGSPSAAARTSSVQCPFLPGAEMCLSQNSMSGGGTEAPQYWETWFDRNNDTGTSRRSDMGDLTSGIVSVYDWDASIPTMNTSLTFFRG